MFWTGWLSRWVWQKQPLDALVFGHPLNQDDTRELARETYHRLLARLASIEVYRRQWWLMAGGLGLCIIAQLLPDIPLQAIGFAIFLSLVFSVGITGLAIWFLPTLLMQGVVTQEIQDEAAGIVKRCFLRTIPSDAPEDLKDVWRHDWITEDGLPRSSELSEEDMRFTVPAMRTLMWGASIATLAIGAWAIPGSGLIEGGLVLTIMALRALFDVHPGDQRVAELEAQHSVEGMAWAAAGGQPWATSINKARADQIAEAVRDPRKHQVVTLGTATGLLAARGDFFAPTEGKALQLSLSDLQTHVLVMGGTGSGKTSGVLRPLALQISQWPDVGLVVFDGKGSLPYELSCIEGYQLLDPERASLSLVRGLEPEVVASTIASILGSKDGDRFWTDSASNLLFQAGVLAKFLGGEWWSLDRIRRIALDPDEAKAALEVVASRIESVTPIVRQAVLFFNSEWPAMEDRVKSNIVATVRTWFSELTNNSKLLSWSMRSDIDPDSVDITDALRGGCIGFNIPAYKYGSAGAVVSSLLKARLYARLRLRAESGDLPEGETPVVFIVDEAQEVTNEDDATMLSIGRSLQFSMVAATQTVEAVYQRLGGHVAPKWLGIYGSLIALSGRSPQTDAFVAERCGTVWNAVCNSSPGLFLAQNARVNQVTGAFPSKQKTVLESQGLFDVGAIARRGTEMLAGKVWHMLTSGQPVTGEPTSQFGPMPLFQAAEVNALLAEPNTAIALTNRARVPRRDIIRLNPVYDSAKFSEKQAETESQAEPPPEPNGNGADEHGTMVMHYPPELDLEPEEVPEQPMPGNRLRGPDFGKWR